MQDHMIDRKVDKTFASTRHNDVWAAAMFGLMLVMPSFFSVHKSKQQFIRFDDVNLISALGFVVTDTLKS